MKYTLTVPGGLGWGTSKYNPDAKVSIVHEGATIKGVHVFFPYETKQQDTFAKTYRSVHSHWRRQIRSSLLKTIDIKQAKIDESSTFDKELNKEIQLLRSTYCWMRMRDISKQDWAIKKITDPKKTFENYEDWDEEYLTITPVEHKDEL